MLYAPLILTGVMLFSVLLLYILAFEILTPFFTICSRPQPACHLDEKVFFSKLPTEQASFPTNPRSLPHITYVLAISPHLTKCLSPVKCSLLIPARGSLSHFFSFFLLFFLFFSSSGLFLFLQALFYLLCMCRCHAATAPTPHILLLCLTYQKQNIGIDQSLHQCNHPRLVQ